VLGDPYLVVRLSGHEYLVPTDGVSAMLQLRGQRLIPARPGGLLSYRLQVNGAWIPIGPPHQALGLKAHSFSARSCCILVERPRPQPPVLRFGVIVDSLSRIEHFHKLDLRLRSDGAPPVPFALGHARLHDKWRPILDLDAIFPPALVLSVSAA